MFRVKLQNRSTSSTILEVGRRKTMLSKVWGTEVRNNKYETLRFMEPKDRSVPATNIGLGLQGLFGLRCSDTRLSPMGYLGFRGLPNLKP